jgi:hypothetical protein
MVSSTLFYQFKVEFQEKKSFNRRMLRKTRLILKHSRGRAGTPKEAPQCGVLRSFLGSGT